MGIDRIASDWLRHYLKIMTEAFADRLQHTFCLRDDLRSNAVARQQHNSGLHGGCSFRLAREEIALVFDCPLTHSDTV
jgi:hypothetical protein